MKNLLKQICKGIKAILGIYSDEVLAEAENKMKEYMDKDFDPDTVAEIDVRKALLELGYSELYAAIRSHCSLQFWKPRLRKYQ